MRSLKLAALFLFLLTWSALPWATELSQPLILVAKPELSHPMYGKAVLVVKPFGQEQHLGFIVNRPTSVTLGSMFPEHGPSQKVVDPVFLGGPVDVQMLIALVERPESPGGTSVEMMPGLFAAFDAPTVDRIIESDPEHARFVAGLVVWRPGELQSEIQQGAWNVMDADPEIALRKPEGLWEELLQRSGGSPNGQRARFIRTGQAR
jgi:putative transcriptional regulator